ncbi:MAG: transglutaminase family protein [Planctomycetes bacterium]|nr:transglutaminase family protein [Planctomycetota bacterium]
MAFFFFSTWTTWPALATAQPPKSPATAPASEDAWLSRIIIDELSRCQTAQEYANLRKTASDAAVERLACGIPANMDVFIDLVYAIRACRLLSAADASANGELNKWLISNRQVFRLFLRAIEECDSPAQAWKNLGELVKSAEKDVLEYPALAVAFATSVPLENYRPQPNPAGLLESFQYYTDPKNRFVYDLHKLPYEVLRYLADTRLSIDERKWALANFAGNKNPPLLYFAVPYDLEHYEKSKPRKNASQDYTLQNLLQLGGVCADQAYFASQVCKSLGIPGTMVKGAGSGGVGHVWLACLRTAANGTGLEWDSQTGRYKVYNFYTGIVRNPSDGKEIADSQLLLTGTASLMALQKLETADAEVFLARLADQRRDDNSVAALKTIKALAGTHNDRFKDLPQVTDKTLKYLVPKRKIDLAMLEELVDMSIRQNTSQVPVWEFIIELRKTDRLPVEHLDRFFNVLVANTSKQFPEFCCTKVLQIIPTIRDDATRDKVCQKTIGMFGWRPDLQARILLDWGDSLRDRGKTDDALKAYQQAASQASNSVGVGIEAADRAEKIYRQANKLPQAIVMYQGLFAQTNKMDIVMEFRQQTAYYQLGKRLAGLLMEFGNVVEARKILSLIGEE